MSKIISKIFSFCAICLFTLAVRGQGAVRVIENAQVAFKKDSLAVVYGANKQIPTSYELAFYSALSFYPELKNTHIRFKHSKIKTTLNVRPTVTSLLFRKKENRRYIIRVNNDPKKSEVLYQQVPFNAQIGLLGHELAHIMDYKQLNILGIAGRGIGYLMPEYRRNYEFQIDLATIKAGLGWQLHDWSAFVQDHPEIDPNYKKYKADNYMGKSTIASFINHSKPTLSIQ